jgi:hypothetical protein
LTYAGQLQRTDTGERMLGTVVDITDRKQFEDELRRHAAALERRRLRLAEREAEDKRKGPEPTPGPASK